MSNIYLIRHGETYFNEFYNSQKKTFKEKILDKNWNPFIFPEWMDLNEKGKKDANFVAEYFKMIQIKNVSIYSSNTKRSLDTAEKTREVLGIRKIMIDNRLNEINVPWEKSNSLVNLEDFLKEINSLDKLLLFTHGNLIYQFLKSLDCQPLYKIQNGSVMLIKNFKYPNQEIMRVV
ncbi:hypothetical protein C0585_03535 [Candidatus Woesearchaeota archaeon]|nr:MAG: hypothetical protein C0585_03535 [Candidatus Woesearchaeota archaeon]